MSEMDDMLVLPGFEKATKYQLLQEKPVASK